MVLLFVGCSSSSAEAPPVDAGADIIVVADAPAADARDAACKLTKAYSSKDVDCNACAESNCCDEVNACFGDKRCDDDYVNCILACALLPADAADAGAERDRCVAECDATHPEGKNVYDAAIGCVDARCTSECQ
jgi:hypothetical protein